MTLNILEYIYFGSKLKFNRHVSELCKKLSRYCGIAHRLKYKLNLHTATPHSTHSTVTYCIPIWGGMLLNSHRGDKLNKLQDRIVKNLFSQFYPKS